MVTRKIAITLNLTNPLDAADIEELNAILESAISKFETSLDRTAIEVEDSQLVSWSIDA